MLPFEEPTLDELLNEPIVRKMMARDRVTERQVCAIAIAARARIERSLHSDLPIALARAAHPAAPGGIRQIRVEQRV
ncbi:hypothetical protein MAE02_19740 [Microvirga aerophila]|uniref:Uncharacterized protein n=1 Tax=Microvirga aerophila TaxID=670291 RepID=A0A512BQQ4_9HYPH|nr:hypothetical protein MAE02_19740 [Microvirga aerophila]